MGLFYNNDVAGSGISKNSKRKKPFFRFWELFFRKFGVFFQVNLIYFLFCIPVITIGPATAAMTAIMRNIYLERPQFIFHDFKEEFKKNFKQALPIGIIDVVGIVLSYFAVMYMSNPDVDQTTRIFAIVGLVAINLLIMVSFYVYPQIVALNLKLREIMSNAVLLMFMNPLGDIITFAFFFGYGILLWSFWYVVVFLTPIVPFAWLCFISVFCCYPTIQKVLINPYYKKTGEKNPEIPEYAEENVFTDLGGNEQPLEVREQSAGIANTKKRGKTIK